MTKIIQSLLLFGFHLLLIAFASLSGSMSSFQRRSKAPLTALVSVMATVPHRVTSGGAPLQASEAITLSPAPELCSLSDAAATPPLTHLAPLASCYLVFKEAVCLSCRSLGQLGFFFPLSLTDLSTGLTNDARFKDFPFCEASFSALFV